MRNVFDRFDPLAEARLGLARVDDLNVPSAPITRTPTTDGIRTRSILFSDITVTDTVPDAGTVGNLYAEYGYGVGISPSSDPTTIMFVSIDGGRTYQRMTPGQFIRAATPFDRVYIKRPTTIPSVASTFFLDIAQSREAIPSYGSGGPFGAQVGSNNIAVTVTASLVATAQNIAPFRASRWKVIIKNEGNSDVWIGAASTVTSSNGFLLAAGDRQTLETNAAVWAISTATGSRVDALEIY